VSSGSSRVLSAPLLLLLLAGGLGMAALCLALPILPLTVAATAHDRASTGIVTAVTAAFTILLELLSPGLLGRFRARTLLLAAMLLQLVAMLGFAELRALPAMLTGGALAGAGFGLAVTVTVAAVGAMVPPDRSGVAIGYFGLCASVPAILGPPVALLLLDARGAGAVFLLGALTCAASIAIIALLPPVAVRPAAAVGGGVLAAMANRGVLRVLFAFGCTTLTYGAALSFTPFLLGTTGLGSAPVFLLVFGATRMLGRVAAGPAVDRVGERRLVVPSLAVGAAALVPLQLHSAPAVLASAAVAGAAFGVVQTAAFVGMLQEAGPERGPAISGIWSMAVDAGIGAGALGMGIVGAAIGFGSAFWLLPALFALGLVLRLAGATRQAVPDEIGSARSA